MANALKYRLSGILAFVFLVSFTGLPMLMHHCFSCESTSIHLFSQIQDCCEAHREHHHHSCADQENPETDCCSQHTDEACENCCKDSLIYLQNDYTFSLDRQILKILPWEFAVLGLITFEAEPNLTLSGAFGLDDACHDPPPRITGKTFLIYTHQLKYC